MRARGEELGGKEVILVLQIGSMGDTVVSVPCYREIARRHPHADIYLLTNFPVGSKMVSAEAILSAAGLIKGVVQYPMPLRDARKTLALSRRLTALAPRVLYYLLPERRLANLLRHYAFFKLCGIPRIVGMPWRRETRRSREIVPGTLWESEAQRLLRCIGAPPGPPSDADRDLCLTAAEQARADEVLQRLHRAHGFVAISVGGKVPLNDWRDANWATLLRRLSQAEPGVGAVFVGSADEHARNAALTAHWSGPSVNACGTLAPRETAALIARAAVFLGHDTATLHLAGAVNTPVVGIFGARNMPGIWYSDRARDRFFYHRVPCAGCALVRVEDCPHDRACMRGHDPADIAAAVQSLLSR